MRLRDRPGARCRRAPTATSPATSRWSYGLVAATRRAGLPLVLGSYPITPASDILHTLSGLKRFGVTTLQAEDEIAGVGCGPRSGRSVARFGVTTTSGPGLALKAETIGLAVSLELPMVVVDVQRGGPSTGLPTKTEQADLLQAMFGRNGESPVPIVAPRSPPATASRGGAGGRADRHDLPHAGAAALRRLPRQRLRAVADPGRGRAARDGGRGTRPTPTAATPRATRSSTPTCATPRRWPGRGPSPGTPGLEHRIGGIEKADVTGEISYDPDNHDTMTRLRQAKVDGIAATIPDLEVDDPTGDADGAGARLGVHLRPDRGGHRAGAQHRAGGSPGPTCATSTRSRANTGERAPLFYKRVVVPEMNLGQLSLLLRAKYLVDVAEPHAGARAAVHRNWDLADVGPAGGRESR